MNEKELRDQLIQQDKMIGRETLSAVEIEFMLQKINFITYLYRCYEDYSKSCPFDPYVMNRNA